MCASPQNGPPEPSLSPPALSSTPPTPQNTSINGQSAGTTTEEELSATEQNVTKSSQQGTFLPCYLKALNAPQLFIVCIFYIFWTITFYLYLGPEPQESDERVGEEEEGQTEQPSEVQDEAEPDSGLGESSVEGGETQYTSFTT